MTAVEILIEIGIWFNGFLVWLAWAHIMGKRFLGWNERLIRTILAELRPIFWPTSCMVAWDTMTDEKLMAWQKALVLGGIGVGWWLVKRATSDDDDDRWKRRRKKLEEKVSVLGGRLAVTPA